MAGGRRCTGCCTPTPVWLPDDLLMKLDRMSMGASLEARVPLLDHVLVEFAATLPPGFKLPGCGAS